MTCPHLNDFSPTMNGVRGKALIVEATASFAMKIS